MPNNAVNRKFRSRFGFIRLRYRPRKGTLTYEQKGGNQSTADRHGVSLDAHIHALYGLTLQQSGKHVLMIGCGGGTLATMLARAGRQVSIVDIDPVSFTVAKRYFGLSGDVACHVSDGLAFLQKTRKRFDTLIVDAFVGEKMPRHLAGPEFFEAALRCLRRNGLAMINVCIDGNSDLTADRVAAGFRARGRATRILDHRGSYRNTIVLIGKAKSLRRPKLLVHAEADMRQTKRELKQMRFRRQRAVKAESHIGINFKRRPQGRRRA
jgi:spermidine synthase